MTEESGGEIVYGWVIWQHGNYFIEAEHHAVYRRSDGSLVDITPGTTKRVLFLPDPSAVYEFGTTKQTDNVRVPLINDPRLDRILALYSERTSLMNSVGGIGGQVTLEGDSAVRYRRIMYEIESLAEQVVGDRFSAKAATSIRP
jgi:hypothetical protein